MKNLIVYVCVMAVVNFASADTIRGINIDFVTIGNAGNAADTQVGEDGTTGYGSVGYNYDIGKYEVTNAQWNTFVATAGGSASNATYIGAQQPINNVTWYEEMQFCNYLTSGDKSKGAYQFSGNNTNPGSFQGINRVSSISTYGTTYVIPTEDEWYKAAYYKPDGSGYSIYANGLNTPPVAGVDTNYDNVIDQPWDVGVGNGTIEQNGTFDMMGNVWEMTETSDDSYRAFRRGGSFYDNPDINFTASYMRITFAKDADIYDVGFRVASVDVIPEPVTLLLLGFGAVALRKRKY